MKYITRELKIYKYTFGKIDVDNNTVYDVFTQETANRLSKRAIGKVCEAADGAVLLKKETLMQKFAMPVDKFIEECRAYSAAAVDDVDDDTDDEDEDEEESEED